MASFAEVLERYAGRLTPRQWRLFACACVRRVEAATRGNSGAAIELAERFADGKATEHQLASARYGGRFLAGNAAWAVCWDPKEDARTMAERAAAWTAGILGELPPIYEGGGFRYGNFTARDRSNDSLLFADITLPLIDPAHFDPLWLAWNDGTVCHLAAAIYDDRDWEQMPILADALEDAGCGDERILGHCRGGGPHVRGCWVVDRVLGMQ